MDPRDVHACGKACKYPPVISPAPTGGGGVGGPVLANWPCNLASYCSENVAGFGTAGGVIGRKNGVVFSHGTAMKRS